jgi:hypothetical protein
VNVRHKTDARKEVLVPEGLEAAEPNPDALKKKRSFAVFRRKTPIKLTQTEENPTNTSPFAFDSSREHLAPLPPIAPAVTTVSKLTAAQRASARSLRLSKRATRSSVLNAMPTPGKPPENHA